MATKAALISEVNTNFADNTIGAITPAITRTTHTDEINSWQQAPQVNAQTGVSYTIAATDYGQLVTFNNASAVAVSIPGASIGGFTTFNVFLKNLGAGTVTVTPSAGTIDNNPTFTLATGQSTALISDGTSWRSVVFSLGNAPVTITPPSNSSIQGLNINQTGAQTGGNGGTPVGNGGFGFAYNDVLISNDARADTGSSNNTFGFQVYMVTGGANCQGNKNALDVRAYRAAPDNTSFPSADLVAVSGVAFSFIDNGGTNTSTGARGDLFGSAFAGFAYSGSTNLALVSASEMSVGIMTGSSSRYRLGVSIVDNGNLQAADPIYDAALEIGSIGPGIGPGFKRGILFSNLHGNPPLSSGATAIGTDGSSVTITNGIDFSAYNITGAFLKGATINVGQGFNLSQTGPNSGSQGVGQINYNQIFVADGSHPTGTPFNTPGATALYIQQDLQSNTALQKYALYVSSTHNSTTVWTGDQIGTQVLAQSSASAGGTNTGSGSAGSIYGIVTAGVLLSGCTNWNILAGSETTVQVASGASTRWRVGAAIGSVDVGQGADWDAALDIYAASGPFKFGILFEAKIRNGGIAPTPPVGAPIASTGTIMGTDGVAYTVTNGIDFSAWNFTGSFLKGPGNFSVDGSGNLATSGFLQGPHVNGPAGLLLDTGGNTFPITINGSTVSTLSTIAIPAGGTAGVGIKISSATNFGIFFGSGVPTLSAGQGSLYLRSDGTANNRLYINTNGTTGWTTFNTAS